MTLTSKKADEHANLLDKGASVKYSYKDIKYRFKIFNEQEGVVCKYGKIYRL